MRHGIAFGAGSSKSLLAQQLGTVLAANYCENETGESNDTITE